MISLSLITYNLGNVRHELEAGRGVKRSTSYYPYGMELGSSSEIEYAFNGKEKMEAHGFNMYDYGARFYDQTLARWHSMDPLAEKFYSVSPYLYCVGNPVMFVDPDGKVPIPIITGTITGILSGGISGGDWKDIGKAAAVGFVGGFITGSGAGLISGAASVTVGTFVGVHALAGGLGGVASNLTAQGIEIAQGERVSIDAKDAAFDGVIGAFTNVAGARVSKGATEKISKVMSDQLSNRVEKITSKTFQKNIKKEVIKDYPAIKKTQINKIANERSQRLIKADLKEVKMQENTLDAISETGIEITTQQVNESTKKKIREYEL